jgi:hypothetical protein
MDCRSTPDFYFWAYVAGRWAESAGKLWVGKTFRKRGRNRLFSVRRDVFQGAAVWPEFQAGCNNSPWAALTAGFFCAIF